MLVQIYTVQTPAEGLAIARMGVDHLGLTPSQKQLPGEISVERAQAIIAAVGGLARMVALSVEENLDDIVAMTRAVRPDILHLCGDLQAVPPAAVAELRQRLPGMPIMQAIPVRGPEALQHALDYQDVAEYLILDSKSDSVTGIGATGETHDWSISRRIVEASRIPVILAGGLSDQNVAEAIRQVRPGGVDSLTHTNRWLSPGKFEKDLDLIQAFVTAARAAEHELLAAGDSGRN